MTKEEGAGGLTQKILELMRMDGCRIGYRSIQICAPLPPVRLGPPVQRPISIPEKACYFVDRRLEILRKTGINCDILKNLNRKSVDMLSRPTDRALPFAQGSIGKYPTQPQGERQPLTAKFF
jgi:hypothetical protein